MTLKPNYFLAFGKTFVWFFICAVVGLGVVPYLRGKGFRVGDVLEMGAFVGLFFGLFVAVFFTPREITWDDERFKIRALYPGSGEFAWRRLEAWSPWGNGTFLIKFQDEQAYQIAPFGYWPKEWKVFRSWLQEHFPEKRTLVWFGVRPVRFGKGKDN